MYSKEDGNKLIRLARETIEDVFLKRKTDLSKYSEYKEKQGVFVTLKKDGELRGCIGFVEPIYELNKAIVHVAKSAAFEDPRFNELRRDEFTQLSIELSILTKPVLIKVRKPEEYLDEIKIGRDGLIIKAGPYSGLLLPQVPLDYDWNIETFLRHLCMKANLTMDAWQNTNYQIFKFSAQIFEEE